MRMILRVLSLAGLTAALAAVMWAQGGATGAMTGQGIEQMHHALDDLNRGLGFFSGHGSRAQQGGADFI